MIGPTPAVHPGEILREEFLRPLGLTLGGLAKSLRVQRAQVERLAGAEVSVTADTALRLGCYFETGPEFWMNLQTTYDIAITAPALVDLQAITPHSAAS